MLLTAVHWLLNLTGMIFLMVFLMMAEDFYSYMFSSQQKSCDCSYNGTKQMTEKEAEHTQKKSDNQFN